MVQVRLSRSGLMVSHQCSLSTPKIDAGNRPVPVPLAPFPLSAPRPNCPFVPGSVPTHPPSPRSCSSAAAAAAVAVRRLVAAGDSSAPQAPRTVYAPVEVRWRGTKRRTSLSLRRRREAEGWGCRSAEVIVMRVYAVSSAVEVDGEDEYGRVCAVEGSRSGWDVRCQEI